MFDRPSVRVGAEVMHAPRVWLEYHPTHFAAFVRDVDGNNVPGRLPRPRVIAR